MNIESQIRKLTRSFYWQKIYNASQKCGILQLFDNKSNFSGPQILALYYSELYAMLYKELSEKDWENLDEKVIEDDIRCDAFLYWRHKEIEKKLYKYKQEMKKMESKGRNKVSARGTAQSHNIYKGPKK